jgi:hypothetical protein
MPVRKNAQFLTGAEQEDFVKACVLMKADIVNPAAAPSAQYSRWDQNVAIHQMIQNAFAPGAPFVNFGHGGAGAYSFLSWHRFFLSQVEKQLQSYVPGVMIPYWDWSDPTPIMTETFLGPNGGSGSQVSLGYFAPTAPGTGANSTPAPAWWPASLTGWILPTAFGSGAGALKRSLGALSGLPTVSNIHDTLSSPDYASFQVTLETGNGLIPFNNMHNGMHTWIGGLSGQMSFPAYSPFDPFFYLHHCNIDRLWAMWQADGHANEYPASGGHPQHDRNDIMYPWTGGAAGYGSNAPIAPSIPMPDFSALGAKRNVDTLDFRAAFDYTYDTLPIIGVGLDRTGSMNGTTPDPMTTSAPDVTKWTAATRGVSSFLQDCETVQQSGVTYVIAGIETFRRLASNDFTHLAAAPGYGLVRAGSPYGRAAFDAAVAPLSPGGSTPLADALLDVHDTLVEPPFGGAPADERRYPAMLTDGLRTSGALMSSIPDGSFTRTAVFAMGFGTGADVDYPTLQTMVDKGETLGTQQVFHGESAGTIDKFYSNALAAAIGFTSVFDPVVELFAGEHSHLDFHATDADDAFLITVQGMDYSDPNWSFQLEAPDGTVVYADGGMAGMAGMSGMSGAREPHVTATRSRARLSLVLQRDNADGSSWIGLWRLMVAWKATAMDGMMMPTLGGLIFPLAAQPARGPRYARLALSPKQRKPQRNVVQRARNLLDELPPSTNRNGNEACNATVNIYARTRLRVELTAEPFHAAPGAELTMHVDANVLRGNISATRALARLAAPTTDLAALLSRLQPREIPASAALAGSKALPFDPAKVLASLEKRDPKLTAIRDEQLAVVTHADSGMHVHISHTDIPGAYDVGVFVEGDYCPEHDHPMPATPAPVRPAARGGHPGAMTMGPMPMPSTCDADCVPQRFSRILSASLTISKARSAKTGRRGAASGTRPGARAKKRG